MFKFYSISFPCVNIQFWIESKWGDKIAGNWWLIPVTRKIIRKTLPLIAWSLWRKSSCIEDFHSSLTEQINRELHLPGKWHWNCAVIPVTWDGPAKNVQNGSVTVKQQIFACHCITLNFRDTKFSRIWPLGHFWTYLKYWCVFAASFR